MVDGIEGGHGPATVIEVRDSPGSRHRVSMDDNNPPPFWAHDFELRPLEEGPHAVPGGYDSRPATLAHIGQVRGFMEKVIRDLVQRAEVHDRSKLLPPEKAYFDEFTPLLSGMTFGSDGYRATLAKMRPALDHHNAVNDHHPEFHRPPPDPDLERLKAARDAMIVVPDHPGLDEAAAAFDSDLRSRESPMRGMDLVSLTEMLCDWKAASLRHADGDIRRSIEVCQRRFGFSDELKHILLNTLPLIEA